MTGSKLYIGNLDHSVTDSDMNELFSQHGAVREVKLFSEKGFGFVEMSTQAEAEKAKAALDGHEYKGRNIKVDMARPPRKKGRGNFRRY